jgi:hypothetical protein
MAHSVLRLVETIATLNLVCSPPNTYRVQD